MNLLNINEQSAEHKIRKEDKRRADNYHYYTGRIWGTASNFDLTVNTDFGVEYIEECVRKIL